MGSKDTLLLYSLPLIGYQYCRLADVDVGYRMSDVSLSVWDNMQPVASYDFDFLTAAPLSHLRSRTSHKPLLKNIPVNDLNIY